MNFKMHHLQLFGKLPCKLHQWQSSSSRWSSSWAHQNPWRTAAGGKSPPRQRDDTEHAHAGHCGGWAAKNVKWKRRHVTFFERNYKILLSALAFSAQISEVVFTFWLREVREADGGTYSISAGSHVFFGIVVVLDQFGSELIQGLEKYKTKRLRVYSISY